MSTLAGLVAKLGPRGYGSGVGVPTPLSDGGLVQDQVARTLRGLGSTMLIALCATGWQGVAPSAARAQPQLTPIELQSDGGTPRIPGEPLPPPGARLPPRIEAPPATPPPKPETPQPETPKPEQPKQLPVLAPPKAPPVVARKPAAPQRPLLELSAGPVWVPSGAWGLVSRLDHHPELFGFGLDLAWHVPLSGRNSLAIRGGIALPNVPAANWYASGSAALPMWTVIKLALIDVAADYVHRTPLSDRLDWMWRAGLGLLVLAGDVERTEALPICAPDKRDTCPHWRHVADGKADLLSRVWPALRLTTGLQWSPTPDTALHIDAGLRDGVYIGAGGALRF